jgi:hypothetical protein
MNAKIWEDPRVPYVGHHSLHNEFNTNGIMMTDFVVIRKRSSEARYKERTKVLCLSTGFPKNSNELPSTHPARL